MNISPEHYKQWTALAAEGYRHAMCGDRDTALEFYQQADEIGKVAVPGSPFALNPYLCLRRHFPGESEGIVRAIPPSEDIQIGISLVDPGMVERPSAEGMQPPVIDEALLEASMRKSLERDSHSDMALVHVLSTGRCGTMSMYHALETSGFIPYHGYHFTLGPVFRYIAAYSQMHGLVPDVTYWWQTRVAEVLGCEENGLRMAMLNHYDTVWAPAVAGIFPKAKFVHLRRDPIQVFRSFYSKAQWTEQQIQPLFYRFDDDGFQWRNARYDEPAAIAWYLRWTDVFCRTFRKVVGDRCIEVSSDLLFAQDRDEIGRLSEHIDAEVNPAVFAVAYNRKAHKVCKTPEQVASAEEQFREAFASFGGEL